MMDFNTWLLFVSASLALAFSPGPGMLYVLSRTLAGGKAVGVASTLGAAMGGLIHVVGAAIGISALLATSALAFTLVTYVGAGFLIYLGLKMLLSAFRHTASQTPITSLDGKIAIKSAFNQGVISELLNPKTALFFLAFIPQFIHPDNGPVFFQFIVLGLIVVILNTLPDFLIAFLSKPIARLWNTHSRFRRAQQVTSGACLIGLGVYLAASGSGRGFKTTSA